MEIHRYQSSTSAGETWEKYGVVNDSRNRALRVEVGDYGPTTHISCRVGYRGEALAFDGRTLNDHQNDYRPLDPQGRRLEVEITPPIADADERQAAAALYAATLLEMESGPPPLTDLTAIAGNVCIRLSV